FAHVLANSVRELVKNLRPGVLRRPLDEVIPANRDDDPPRVLHKLAAYTLRVGVDVIRESLRYQKPDNVRGQNQRPMIVEGEVNRRHHRMKLNVGDEATMIARAGFDWPLRLHDSAPRLLP